MFGAVAAQAFRAANQPLGQGSPGAQVLAARGYTSSDSQETSDGWRGRKGQGESARRSRGADETSIGGRCCWGCPPSRRSASSATPAPARAVSTRQGRGGRHDADRPKGLQEINVALLGAGAQGQVLLDAMLRIPGLRFRAVCDIWTEYNQRRVVNTLKRYKFEVNGYEDYREMLDKEKELDAVVIATPDFWHAPHTIDCLKAGKHVYCEKEMSNTLEGARSMVRAPRDGQAAPDRPPAPHAPALPPLPRQAAERGQAARAHRHCQRPVEPRRVARPRGARPLRHSGGQAEAVRLQGHAPVPQLALVQGARRRADRRPRLAPNRHLQLVPRREPVARDGQRRAARLSATRRTSGTTP